jgi:hypothetical protein
VSVETATEILPDGHEVLASPPEAKRRFGGPQFPREGKIRLVNRANLDQRTLAARKFDNQVAQIKADLGGDLSAIELALVESFCGATVMLDDMNVQVLTGQKVDVADYCQLTSTLTRVASRLGLRRKPRDVTPSLGSYLADRSTAPPEPAEADDEEEAP